MQAVPTSKVAFAQCAFGSPFQKLTTVMASGHAASAVAILRRTCTHETHAETALGDASARSARYPPALNVALADRGRGGLHAVGCVLQAIGLQQFAP